MNTARVAPRLLGLVFLQGLLACQPPPWGAGAVELPESSARIVPGVERRLDAEGLARASDRLMAATTTIRDRGLVLDLPEAIGEAALPVTRLGFETDAGGLVLKAAIPPLSLPLAADAPSCDGTLDLGPGEFTLSLSFATDKLGRIHLAPSERANWSGPLGTAAPESCPGFDEGPLADLLVRQVPPLLNAAFGAEIVTSLGLRLAAPLGDPGLTGGSIFRAHLRARSDDPVTPRDAGIAAHFELALQTGVSPCLAPLTFPVGRTPDETSRRGMSPDAQGLFVPVEALSALAEALSLHGALCGRLSGTAPWDLPTLLHLAPSWEARIGAQPISDIELAWSPQGPATLAVRPDATLVWEQPRTDFDVWARWAGARWRLGSFSAALSVGLEAELHPDGQLVSWVGEVEIRDVTSAEGLLPPLPPSEVGAILRQAVRQLLNGQRLLALPPELTPAELEPVAIDPALGLIRLPTP